MKVFVSVIQLWEGDPEGSSVAVVLPSRWIGIAVGFRGQESELVAEVAASVSPELALEAARRKLMEKHGH